MARQQKCGNGRVNNIDSNPFLHLTPDRVLDVAYCYHVAQEPLSESKKIGRLSRKTVEEFEEILNSAEFGSSEWKFGFEIKQIIVSLARGITRGKLTYLEQVKAAYEEKEERIKEMTDSTKKTGLIRGSFKAILLGGFGFAMTRAFAPVLPLPESTDPQYMSFATAIAVVLIATWVQGWLINYKVVQIFACYDHARRYAYMRYRIDLKVEYMRAKENVKEAWERYTGKKPSEWPAFEAVIEEEIRLEEAYQAGRYELTTDPFVKLFTILGPREMMKNFFGIGKKEQNEKEKEKVS